MKYLYIDAETTGLSAKGDRIFQLSGMIEINGRVTEEFNFHLEVDPEIEWSDFSKNLYEINLPNLPKKVTPKFAYNTLLTMLDKAVDRYNKADKLFIVGYNVQFDLDFLYNFFIQHGNKYLFSYLWGEIFDVRSLMAFKVKEKRFLLKDFKLDTITKAFNIEFRPHDSFEDIKATRKLFQKLL